MAKTHVRIFLDEPINPRTIEVLKDFLSFCQKKLRIKHFPDFYFHSRFMPGMTTGEYSDKHNELHVLIEHRLTVDVLRTIAHELTHAKQHEEGKKFKPHPIQTDADLNADYENEAYIKSGNYVKEFIRHYKKMSKNEIYALREVVERLVEQSLVDEVEAESQGGPVRKKFHIPLPEDLLQISRMFQSSGKQFFLVGGAVRDALMGLTPKDFDIATDAQPDDVVAILTKNPRLKILEIGKAFGVVKVITPEGNEYELATFRRDLGKGRRPDAVEFTDIAIDSARRDLSINALFYDIEKQEIVDYVGGMEDIEKGVIRTVGSPEERFDEDRLRILRTLRFAARIGSGIDPQTSQAIKSNNSLSGVSGERIRDEFLKGIKSAKSVVQFFHLISEYNLWEQIFPGLVVSRDFKESKNIPVALGCLLRENHWKTLMTKLNELKYPVDEVQQISFLSIFLTLSVPNAFKLKKLFKNSRLSNSDLVQFSHFVGKPEEHLVKAFIKFEPSVTGMELQAQGFSGKELGQELERLETQLFSRML